MVVTPTDFRQNLFKLLDEIIKTGKTLEINRNGEIIQVVPPQKRSKLDRLTAHPDAVVGNSDDFVRMDWNSEWKPSI
ncbi:MAG: type II toxin-antitoxin system Phd/YefM family antitoxin [Campylobacterales bacterium]|nr:type II toxin-antitoxin system Phd/YefM family antitoxin [Campylobacterales bacterium]